MFILWFILRLVSSQSELRFRFWFSPISTKCSFPFARHLATSNSGYSCSKALHGTGGSREPPVPVKGVQAILAIGGSREILGWCVCVCCTICKATDAQFAEPQTHILQSNRSVQSTAETSCLPCSVAVALTAIGLTTIGLDACSVTLQFNH